MTEVESTQFRLRICSAISQQLIGEWVHATARLPATDSTDDDCAGKQATLRDG
jgi:hypothetical protein